MNTNTKAHHDGWIEASENATEEDFQEHLQNLRDVINYLDDLVSTWKKDYDKLEADQKAD